MKTRKWYGMIILSAAVLLVSCGGKKTPEPQVLVKEVAVETDYTRQVPGVVEYVWEEPMVDVVDIPPGLDPEGHYYRPAHQSIVEIKQGRWRYQRPNKQVLS